MQSQFIIVWQIITEEEEINNQLKRTAKIEKREDKMLRPLPRRRKFSDSRLAGITFLFRPIL